VTYETFGAVDIGTKEPTGRTVTGKIDQEHAKLLNHLIQQVRDLHSATSTAGARLEDQSHRAMVAELQHDHEEAIAALSDKVLALGGEPAQRGDLGSLIERGRVVINQLRGERGLIESMATNEETLGHELRRALATPHLPGDLRTLIGQILETEERHTARHSELLGRFVG
jgi:hypothetical protein